MKLTATAIADVKIIEPQVFGDGRGFFFESYNHQRFCQALGREVQFVQDNHSGSARGVLRGLHYQIHQPQGKLVRVVQGAIFDVAVDLRASSPTFGRHVSIELSAENRRMLWIPPGFAHGFSVRSEQAEVLYKTTDYWSAQAERGILWCDPALAIAWPLDLPPVLSDKDRQAPLFADAERFA